MDRNIGGSDQADISQPVMEGFVTELSDVHLALIGGGVGEVVFG
jgi:hypothetical protein